MVSVACLPSSPTRLEGPARAGRGFRSGPPDLAPRRRHVTWLSRPPPATLRAWRGRACPDLLSSTQFSTPTSVCSRLFWLVLLDKHFQISVSRCHGLFSQPRRWVDILAQVCRLCSGSVWQWGVHFWVSGKSIVIRQFCYGRRKII
uniref:Uncharacterized protein n=1 Tax=Rousettus aegyptiacus TaxID=9407 RepID=A0A7J8G9Y8_ROUAE|nr:hypothetical protein HJG63_011565 [Rousettus aegyptiacus]